MKINTLILSLMIFLCIQARGQTVLSAGDLAFTRIGMDSPDAFSFVFLVPVTSGTIFYITDEGVVNNTKAFSFPAESTFKFTATSAILAGEEAHISTSGGPSLTFTGSPTATIEDIGKFVSLANGLGSGGDQLFIVQGTFNNTTKVVDSPTFIAGINANGGVTTTSGKAWQSVTGSSTANSAIPMGQTNGADGFLGIFPNGATQGEVDNARYKTTALHTGDKATVLAAIMDLSNWEYDNTDVFAASGTAFSIASSAPTSVDLAVTVFLEGAYNGTDLNTSLNPSIPLTQPYSNNGHSGGETAGAIPAGAVDWVLVELREAASAATALANTKVGSAAGFLMSDGTIKVTDGTSNLTVSLSGNTGADFFVVIYHRNHLPIMSANAISESSSVFTVDFSSVSANTYQGLTGLASLSGGRFGMLAGDTDGDGDIDSSDLTTWRSQNGAPFSYNTTNGDFNLDGVVNAVDRNDFQQKNNSKTSQVPTT
ncbi:MAG: hypothetical protein HEP71_16775 [Roseivirga sp.]|nr:hypothetical protein [Roseivirga sp.]